MIVTQQQILQFLQFLASPSLFTQILVQVSFFEPPFSRMLCLKRNHFPFLGLL